MAINIPSAHSKFIRIGCAYRSVKQNFYTDILPTVSSRSISIQRIESITSWNKTNKLSSLTDQPIKSISQNRGYTTYIAQHLADRTLIRVSGQEAAEFLQGLVTNDIDHLKNNPNEGMLLFTASSNSKLIASNEEIENASPLLNRSIYAMFLNTSGRVMFDVIITRLLTDTFVIDCNIEFAPKLVKHLKMYRVRRKIDLSIRDRCEIWAVFCKDIIKPGDLSNRSMAEDFVNLGISPDGVVSTIDPRMKQLGFRIAVLDRGSETAKKLNSMKLGSMDDHKELRFRLGVGECPSELHPGKALPLESNADYLHGVSFHKGCYIGQELTARTHHTGVIRKRIMPLIIHNPRDVPLESELNLHNENSKKSVGKLKSYVNEYGIGLMRVEDCLHAQNNGESIVVSDKNDITVKVLKPDWWPET